MSGRAGGSGRSGGRGAGGAGSPRAGRDGVEPSGASRWIGWITVAAAVFLGLLWLSRDTSLPTAEADDVLPVPELPETLEGFRSDLWYLPDDSLLGFVEVPGGPVVVGSDPAADPMAYEIERWSSSQPRDTLELPRFFMSRHEVTVAQFRTYAEDVDAPVPDDAFRAPPDHPVSHVTWPDAVAYARWLDRKLREAEETPDAVRSLLERGWRVMLPTEIQWEKAARGSDDRIFPWGDEPRRGRANVGGQGTVPVGSLPCPECPYGLTDMSGNVWEWTRSPYQAYPYTEADDRENLEADALWVIRGGSFQDSFQNARAAVRGGGDPGARRPFVGFRVALTPPS